MRKLLVLAGVVISIVVLAYCNLPAANPARQEKDAKPVGIQKRDPWITSRVHGSPEPPAPYRTESAFPKLKFFEPLDMTFAPGTDRLFVAERPGKIYSFINDPKTDKKDLFLDLKKVVYGFTFHPQFEKNGYVYVTYLVDHKKDQPKGTRMSRFQVKRDNRLEVDLETEKVILEWPSGGHNGGCLKFGPDGFLYIATGDGSGIADELQTGQDLSDLLGAILRIDVDQPVKDKGYRVPTDNPFRKMKDARPEIWAYGLRQPWRMSFDRRTGDLWAGEVGQDLWEMVYRIERGGNYGWSVTEGKHPFRPERKRGPTPILQPVVEHPHSDFRSITGGFVYHGNRLKELQGAYVYGDFDTGRVWSLRVDGKKVTEHRELVDTALRIVSFAEDREGELYLVDFSGGGIHRLAQVPKKVVKDTFPRKLSDTGLFESVKNLKPAPGLIPYSVNSQLWADYSTKERYLALPGRSQIEFDAVHYPHFNPKLYPNGWRFPDGTVIVKTFFLEMERGNPASKRRLETRILHYEQLSGTEEYGDQYWQGYTYLWNDEQTEATLLDAGGLDRTYTILDKKAPGGKVQQTWRFPSRAECTLCHTMAAKYVLGVNTLQLNKDHAYGGVKANQLRTLEHLGIFTKPLPAPPENLPRLVDHEDETQDLNLRARSYLHSNCAHCHTKWGGGNADFKLLFSFPLKDAGIVNVPPGQGNFGIDGTKLLVPGDPARSMIYHRMTKTGLGRMPHIATSIVDEKAAKVLHEWIKELK